VDISKTEFFLDNISRQLYDYSAKVMSLVSEAGQFRDDALDKTSSLIKSVKWEHNVLQEKYRKYDEMVENLVGYYYFMKTQAKEVLR